MQLGGLRGCEVLGLGLADLNVGERRMLIANGEGGLQRVRPLSARFFEALAVCLSDERPSTSTDRVLVALKGPRRQWSGSASRSFVALEPASTASRSAT